MLPVKYGIDVTKRQNSGVYHLSATITLFSLVTWSSLCHHLNHPKPCMDHDCNTWTYDKRKWQMGKRDFHLLC